MRLKKLIAFLLCLFVLSALSYAGFIPQIIFKATSSGNDVRCNFTKQTPESEYPSLTDSNYKFKVGQYAGRSMSVWELSEIALKKNDRVATEILKYCVRSNNHGDLQGRTNENGLTLLQVAAYYNGKNADDIIKYLIEKHNWEVDAAASLNTYYITTRTALAAATEVDNKERAKFLVGYKANPLVEIYDNSLESMTVFKFAKEKESHKVYTYFETLKLGDIVGMVQDAAYKNINYAMTNKDEFSRLMEKIKSNGIVADFLRALDGNTLMRTNYNLI
jgi:hypothetical protein